MSNYTKSTNFATKDNLTPGDPLKVVRGTEIDTEYNNIATAIATKTDNASAAITGGTITGITDLAVADGGTGASTAAGALNNLLPSQTSAANKYLQSDGTNASWDAVSLSTADITGTLAVANGGTGVTTSTGTTNVVLSNSPTLVTPALGTPSAAVLTNATGLPISTGVSGLGTGVATLLATPSSANLASAITDETGSGSLVFATSPTLVTPVLGTPTSATLTNATGLPISTGVSGLGSGVATFLATPSSANLAAALTDETGSGANVFATSPTLVTPTLGVATATSLQGIIGNVTPAAGSFTTVDASGSVTLSGGTANGVTYLNGSKVLTSGSALTFDGTDFATTGTGTFVSATATAIGLTVKGRSTDNISKIAFTSNAGSTEYGSILASASEVRLNNAASNLLTFYSSNAEQMRLTSTGLGIGTSSPAYKLDVQATSTAIIQVKNTNGTNYAQFNSVGGGVTNSIGSDSTGGYIEVVGANPQKFYTNGSERARINSSGNLLLGTTSASGARLDVKAAPSAAPLALFENTASREATIEFKSAHSAASDYRIGASINIADAFEIASASTSTTRLAITSAGEVLVGTTSTGASQRLAIVGAATLCMMKNTDATDGTARTTILFRDNGDNTRGSITVSTSGTVYNTTSDYRLKENIAPMTGALAKVSQLNPVTYTWKETGDSGQGFIAHELAEVVPECVTGEKDAVEQRNGQEFIVPQGIDTSFLVATLTSALQELNAKFEAYVASHP